MCATSLGWRHLMNAYGVKARWLVTFVDKRVGVMSHEQVPFLSAFAEFLRRCAIQINVYFALRLSL